MSCARIATGAIPSPPTSSLLPGAAGLDSEVARRGERGIVDECDVLKPTKPLLQTLDMLSPSQIAAIRKIPVHDAAPAPAIETRQPAAIFTIQARYDLEQAKVFRKRAAPVTLSVMLSEPGSAMAHDGYGVPLLVTRDRDGQAHAFLNVCQERRRLVRRCLDGTRDQASRLPYLVSRF